MGRPFDKHIDNEELNALVASPAEGQPQPHGIPAEVLLEAQRHVESCQECSGKVSKYRQIVSRTRDVLVPAATPPGPDCPNDIDWHEVAAGLWPELKTKQLIMHAALCDHCGPLLRAAISVDDDPTPQEEELLTELKAPSRPEFIPRRVPFPPSSSRRLVRWLVPALAIMVIALVVISTRTPSSVTPFSGLQFAEFAVNAHRQHAQGNLALDVQSDSQQALNEWLKTKSPFNLVLPASPAAPGEERPYHLKGARLVPAGRKTAVYIAYQMQSGPVSLVVAPDSIAVASGGVEANFKKVSFHYRTLEGYKVVTWTLHGKTYALVSEEGNSTQRSCMVCHSAMRDRDLSHTPTPLSREVNIPVLQ